MPKISIIVPVYKVERCLSNCIDSIIVQSFQDWELLLIDDGSPDMSGAICDEYAKIDKRIKVLHKSNGGVSSARNYGIEHASGEWMCFIDSDDIVLRTYLEDFELDKTYADIYMQGYVKKKGDRIVEKHDFANCKGMNYFSILAYSEDNCIINSPCFKLFKRSIIEDHKVRFDINTSYGEDHLFSLSYVKLVDSVHYSMGEGYVYCLSETESLTQRVVPYKEISYYAFNAKKLHDDICKRTGGYVFLPSVGLTFMTNYIRTLKYLAKADTSYNDFKWVRDNYVKDLKGISINSLSMKYKILRQITILPIYPILYFFVVKLLKR